MHTCALQTQLLHQGQVLRPVEPLLRLVAAAARNSAGLQGAQRTEPVGTDQGVTGDVGGQVRKSKAASGWHKAGSSDGITSYVMVGCIDFLVRPAGGDSDRGLSQLRESSVATLQGRQEFPLNISQF